MMQTRIRQFLAMTLIGALSLILAPRSDAQIFTNLHNLANTNGARPSASLIVSGSILYGTTLKYGSGSSGSAFRMNADGSGYTNLHAFSGGTNDGGNISSSLLLAGNTLYGTAGFGGASNFGSIFRVNTDGTGYTNIYNFVALDLVNFPSTNKDGAYPDTGMTLSGSTLYGTASGGGTSGWGMIFAVSTNGTGYTNLHSFTLSDGQYPGPLTLAGSTLYGAAGGGGDAISGSIFRLNTNGTGFTKLYSFTSPSYSTRTNDDGASPQSNLLLSGSTLYGTSRDGGLGGSGTIFKIETNGTGFTALYHFDPTNGLLRTNISGAHPQAGLILWNNSLYGTAKLGGKSGNGTIFRLNTNGTDFTVLYSFTATNAVTNLDGALPLGGLVLSGGKLYGTASEGGTFTPNGTEGNGTIFSLLLPPPLSIARSGTNVVLSWDTNVTGFALETTTNLGSSWTNLAGQYNVTNPISGSRKLYRLKH